MANSYDSFHFDEDHSCSFDKDTRKMSDNITNIS